MTALCIGVAVLVVCALVELRRQRRRPDTYPDPPLVDPFAALRANYAALLRDFLADADAALEHAPFAFDPVAFEARRGSLSGVAVVSRFRIESDMRLAAAGLGFGIDETWCDRAVVWRELISMGCTPWKPGKAVLESP